MKQNNYHEKIELKDGHILYILDDDDGMNPRIDQDNFGHMACWHSRYHLGDCQEPHGERNRRFTPLHSDTEDMLCSITGSHPDDPEFKEELDDYGKVIKEALSYNEAMQLIWTRAKEKAIILPLFLYDHSGISISIGSFIGRAQHADWDSGQTGWIYATLEEARENFKADEKDTVEEWYGRNKGKRIPLTDVITRMLKGEVETYDQYLRGNCFGFRVMKTVQYEKTPVGGGETVIISEEEEEDSCWGFLGYNWLTNGIYDNISDDLIPDQYKKAYKEAIAKLEENE